MVPEVTARFKKDAQIETKHQETHLNQPKPPISQGTAPTFHGNYHVFSED